MTIEVLYELMKQGFEQVNTRLDRIDTLVMLKLILLKLKAGNWHSKNGYRSAVLLLP